MPILISNFTESDGRNPVVLFDNLLVDSTPDEPDAEVTLDESTYNSWEFTLNQTVVFDLGSPQEYSAFAIVGNDTEADITLSSSTDGSTFTGINTSTLSISKSDCTLVLFNQRDTRYFRVQFTGSGSGSIRGLWLGKPFEFLGGVGYGYTPVWMAEEKELLVSKTLNGQFVGNRVVSKGASTTIPMVPEERMFVEEDMQPFIQHYNDGKPFIWAAGPTVFTKDVSYVWRQDGQEINPVFDQSGNWMSFSMAVEGYVAHGI